ncbi:MAG TPA: hypothetical protein VGD59_13630 [Acidisarcina sp.]
MSGGQFASTPSLKTGLFSTTADYPPYVRPVLATVMLVAVVYYAVMSFHWPLVWDGTVLHYINFLIAHGFVPYRDVHDMNMPGAYLLDSWQMHIFGPGDVAWRFYEYFLIGCLLAAMMVIALPYDWLAGLVAGVLFTVVHAAEGPINSAQRDEAMTVLLLAGYALLFQSLRTRRPLLLLPFGVVMGLAIGVKPTVGPLVVLLGLIALYVLWKRGEPMLASFLYTVGGIMLPVAIILYYLLHQHALRDFLDLSSRLTPYYAGLMKEPLSFLLTALIPHGLHIVLLAGVVLAVLNWNWVRDWERWALLLGVAGGAFSFLVQGKGYTYQRYPFVAFALLWVAIEFTRALRRRDWVRWAGLAVLLFCALRVVAFLPHIHRSDGSEDAYMRALEGDLNALGGTRALQGQVQCLDMVDGCLGALYHLDLVQNTGFTGDTLFFVRDHAPAVEFYRRIFWDDVHRAPPRVFVLSDEWFNWPRGFDKVDHWPEFAEYLNKRYTLSETRRFKDSAYRIYLLKQ